MIALLTEFDQPDRIGLDVLDNNGCYQGILPKAQGTPTTWLCARYEGPIECLC